MKKLVFAMVVAVLCLGCGDMKKEYYTATVINESTKTVFYDYVDSSDTLAPAESKTYLFTEHIELPTNILDGDGIASIKMTRYLDDITFSDEQRYFLEVFNSLPVDITIKADNYIYYNEDYEDDSNPLSLELKIEAGKTVKTNLEDFKPLVFIYTLFPAFTVVGGDLAAHQVVFDKKVEFFTLSVTIR